LDNKSWRNYKLYKKTVDRRKIKEHIRRFNEISMFVIYNNLKNLERYSKYELNDKLKETIECCNELKLKKYKFYILWFLYL